MADDRDSLREIYDKVLDDNPGARATSATGDSTRYKNLESVSKGLRAYGTAVKVAGLMVAILGFGAGFYLAMEEAAGFGGMVLILGIGFGGSLHAFGTLIAACGEGLVAVMDVAVNTGETAALLRQKRKR